ncbi:hypothetical protein C4D60_Mb03t02820 [Musa balbisiana]|uniref:Uncharacterized protein n=1 Tax=Musa balbisiana TaxID=52838 RepID=A0A4S8J9I6_MUSBA|nr:hypothetical protein C4D60_Mb03t02820 [Musa balbisiana]
MDDSEGTPDQKTTLAKEEEEGGATVPASEVAQEVVAEMIEEEVTAVPVSQEAQDVSLELEQPEEREPEAPAAGVLEDLSSAAGVVPADGPPPANEEVVQVANAVAETSNTCIEAEPLSSETVEESVPALNSLVSQVPRDSTELCRETGDSEASTGMWSFPSCYH